jgi:hypothetical protein
MHIAFFVMNICNILTNSGWFRVIVVKSVSRRVFREMKVTSSISGCDPTKTGYLAGMIEQVTISDDWVFYNKVLIPLWKVWVVFTIKKLNHFCKMSTGRNKSLYWVSAEVLLFKELFGIVTNKDIDFDFLWTISSCIWFCDFACLSGHYLPGSNR